MTKVAIVNRTNLKNYGSVLQVYALAEALKSIGHDVDVVWVEGSLSQNYDFRPNKIVATMFKLLTHPQLLKSTLSGVKYVQSNIISENTIKMFDDFVDSNIKRKFYPAKKMRKNKIGQEYDKFVCGSDQIWCSTTTYVDPLMYLRFVPEEKRVAYAPSLGRDYIPNYNKRKMKKYIKEIPYVSIREHSGKKLIKELSGRDIPVVADPTLLLAKEKWNLIKIAPDISSTYVLCYFLSTPTLETQKKLYDYIQGKGKNVIALNSRLEYLEKQTTVLYPDCGPGEFVGYVSEAVEVLTDSYHGMLFSIIYNKQFWSIEREYGEFDQSSRQLSILEKLGISNRYIGKNMGINKSENKIDYSKVESRLKIFMNESMKFLEQSISK